jgi:hypothetical protein
MRACSWTPAPGTSTACVAPAPSTWREAGWACGPASCTSRCASTCARLRTSTARCSPRTR